MSGALADTAFRYNERDTVRVPKLNRLLAHLVDLEDHLIESLVVTTTVTAGEALGGHRAVRVGADGLAWLAEPDSTARLTIGITIGAAVAGADATIQVDGEIEEPGWAWADDEIVWLAAGGLLTQIPPTSGVSFQVGVPMGPTRLRIQPQLMGSLA
jgi:hypothetical protein